MKVTDLLLVWAEASGMKVMVLGDLCIKEMKHLTWGECRNENQIHFGYMFIFIFTYSCCIKERNHHIKSQSISISIYNYNLLLLLQLILLMLLSKALPRSMSRVHGQITNIS